MRRSFFLVALVAALGCVGCAGYGLGPGSGSVAGAKSVQVKPFSNATLDAKLGDAMTTALRHSLQNNGTYQLATQDDGDIIVSGTVIRYERIPLSYQPTDVLSVLDVRLNMTAHVTATERRTGKVVFDRDISGYTLIRVGSDLTSAERQGLPLVAENLAAKITALLADGSW